VANLAAEAAVDAILNLDEIPYVAALGAFSNYDSAFAMIRWATDDRRRRVRARMVLAWELRLRARHVGVFDAPWCKRLTAARSLTEARGVVRLFRAEAAAT
jgi:hypothetical protein